MRPWKWLSVLSVLIGFGSVAYPWGPHPAITQAALDALGANDPLVRYLGPEAQRLTNYAWMADYRNLIFEEPGDVFYANDFLLFPEAPEHLDHICPEVQQTFRPYFLRAIQALRTETPTNAARWIGSLLHFVEDAGSPPHAAQIRGGLHSRMENWIDPRAIHIGSYQPRSFGTNVDNAFAALVGRMDELIAFSKARAGKIKLNVTIGNRGGAEPLILECALETSRVTADLLHTLGSFVEAGDGLSALQGKIVSREPFGGDRFPGKVVLEGTSYSTVADSSGRFEFRDLPPGVYRLLALRAGNGVLRSNVTLLAGPNDFELPLPTTSANLIRNGDFTIEWVRQGEPDCWLRTKNSWEGEVIPLVVGQRYRLRAGFKAGPKTEVAVRWAKPATRALPRFAAMPKFETRTLTRANNTWEFAASEDLGLLQISLRTGGQKPRQVFDEIVLEAAP